jgi:hypothetical protein
MGKVKVKVDRLEAVVYEHCGNKDVIQLGFLLPPSALPLKKKVFG